MSTFLGLDFGTESVRATVVDAHGRELGGHVSPYAHGQVVPGSRGQAVLFPNGLEPDVALQHPRDWIEGAAEATRLAVGRSSGDVAGIGVSFTSCTVLPVRSDGTPLCESRAGDVHAWPKLWKHHGAVEQTARLNDLALARDEPWLARYGGIVGLEWLFPKVLEVIERAPEVADDADIWLEAGDWLVWQLTGALVRSTCQAGYKALWSASDGYPSREFFASLHPGLAAVFDDKLPGRFVAPGQAAGGLCESMAGRLGLETGIPVSAAIIDAHAGVPGAGVGEAGSLVMVMGTSGCHMLLGADERPVPGVAGIVRDGILPGFVGYETGQAAMGDSFDTVRRLTGHDHFVPLDDLAASIVPGADGVLCMDWFNGCRTPLMDGSLRGGFVGLGMHHTPGHLYRAALEASAMGLRWIVDELRGAGIPVERFVATGGLPTSNPLFVRIVAAVLDAPVHVHRAPNGSALGAAILGALVAGDAAGGFDDVGEAIARMAGPDSASGEPQRIDPEASWTSSYEAVYARYRALADAWRRDDSPARASFGGNHA